MIFRTPYKYNCFRKDPSEEIQNYFNHFAISIHLKISFIESDFMNIQSTFRTDPKFQRFRTFRVGLTFLTRY